MNKIYSLLFVVLLICFVSTPTLWSAESVNPFSAGEVSVEKSSTSSEVSKTTATDDGIKEAAKKEKEKEEEEKKDEESKAKADPDVFDPPITGTVEVGNSTLNVRTGEWETVVSSLRTGDTVSIVGKKGVWYKAIINGQTRYIHMNYVSTGFKPAGKTPVVYPWQNSSSSTDAGVIISQKAIDSCGWGGVYPNEPPAKYISSPFGYRTHPVTGVRSSFHDAVDLPCVSGSRLNALAGGVVTASGYESGGGNYLIIRYANGYESFYCHLLKSLVSVGDKVSAGEKVALADNTGVYTTGSHLHMRIKYNGAAVDPQKLGIPLTK